MLLAATAAVSNHGAQHSTRRACTVAVTREVCAEHDGDESIRHGKPDWIPTRFRSCMQHLLLAPATDRPGHIGCLRSVMPSY